MYAYSKWPVTQGDYLKASLTTSRSTETTFSRNRYKACLINHMSMKLGHNLNLHDFPQRNEMCDEEQNEYCYISFIKEISNCFEVVMSIFTRSILLAFS